MSDITLTHDDRLNIATGKSRRETNWKNREWPWSDLVRKLSVTHRTAETHAEYITSKKPRQDEIKDIGGFVGGYLQGGKRRNGSVVNRRLITLDIDHGSMDVWASYCLLYSAAACIYSTHKHSPEAPRLRLIIPLNRDVFADEYVAISRRVAGNLGIEVFDDTTFQPTRLMYWPSTPKDGEYLFEYQDGPFLDADAVLGTYMDWTDSSEWPVSERTDQVVQRGIKKQGDPLEKPGLVGAFCRVHTISEAIEQYLSDVYEACDTEDRYTYREGSTTAGLIVYDDKFAYSHHGTDPTSGKLCNAFDLVRHHLFGIKDEDAREGTPGNKLPSFTAMTGLAATDSKVRKQLATERLDEARSEFSDNFTVDDEGLKEAVNNDWLEELECDKKSNTLSTINNVVLILKNDPGLKGCFGMNVFEKREVALKNLPWRKVTSDTKGLVDADDASLRHYLELNYKISAERKIKDALDIVVSANAFHPIRDYLDSLHWDGVPRVERMFIDYMGCQDSEYTRTVTRKFLAGAVARIRKPGVKFDYMTILVGEQGEAKSEIFACLGGQWYSDSFTTVEGTKAYESVQGVWIVEVPELSGMKKADVETVKHFISKKVDRYRVAYGRRIEDYPRQCVFGGTSNNRTPLRDQSGGRRFWPLLTMIQEPVKNVYDDLTPDEVGQLWAEAIELYEAGEPLYLSKEMDRIAAQVQDDHTEQDDRTGVVEKYLDTLLPDTWESMDIYQRREYLRDADNTDAIQAKGTTVRNKVCVAEIWCEALGGQLRELVRHEAIAIHDMLRRLRGWQQYKTKMKFGAIYGVQRGYIKIEKSGSKPRPEIGNRDELLM